MIDRDESTRDSPEDAGATRRTRNCKKGRHGGFAMFLIGLGVVIGLVAGLAIDAGAHGGWSGPSRGHGAATAEQAHERLASKAEWVLDAVDATDPQRGRINAVLGELVGEVFPMRVMHRTQREALARALGADDVDPEALEAIRAETIALADAASQALTRAIGEIAAVLEPGQRRKLLERIERHHK